MCCRRHLMESIKQLIITADDFGYSDERDEGIIHCYKSGCVSGATLMVNGHSCERAVKSAAALGFSLDLHLNLTEGRPISNGTQSFTDDNGFMLGKMGFREAVSKGSVDFKEIQQEIQAQINRFQSLTGEKPKKIDGHQHIHIIPGICEVFAQTLAANHIYLTRVPIESGISSHTWSSSEQATFMSEIQTQSHIAAKLYTKYGIKFPNFAGLKTMGQDMSVHRLQSCIQDSFKNHTKDYIKSNIIISTNLTLASESENTKIESEGQISDYKCQGQVETNVKSIVCELMVHPGNITGNVGGCGDRPDQFSQSPDREHEMKILLSKDMQTFYQQNNISLISFDSIDSQVL